jgi:hypothetical protein
VLGDGHKEVPTQLLVLLLGVATRVTLVGVLLPLFLALSIMEDGSHCLLAGGKVGGNVQELPSCAWALVSQLLDQLLAGGPREECSDDISVSNIGQLGALPREVPNVLAESLIWLLAVDPKVLGVARAHIGALEVPHENLHEVSLVVDAVGREML